MKSLLLFYLALTGICLAARPNVIFFLVDDMGYKDLGCYGSTYYETPHIDQLAESGIKFTQAYAACAVCSPSRHAILSGKYPARTGCTNFGMHMDTSEFTLAEAMKNNGYSTYFIGKWHLGDKQGEKPEEQGFDVNIAGGREGQPGSYFWPYKSTRKGKVTETTQSKHLMQGGNEGEYLTDRLGDEAIKLIKNHDSSNPFFMYFCFYSVHTPIQAKQEDIDYFKEKLKSKSFTRPNMLKEGPKPLKQNQDSPEFAAMVKSVDDAVGKIQEQLEVSGLAEDTIIIFTSDNGGASYYNNATSNYPLRGAKGWYFEGGIREPTIISWPNKMKPSVSNQKLIGTDFYPTILDLVEAPLIPEQHLDGRSIKPHLLQQKPLTKRNLYWYYPHRHGSGVRPSAAIVSGDYKLIQSLTDNSTQLYNLKQDLSEKNDLSKSMPEKSQELLKHLSEWQQSHQLK